MGAPQRKRQISRLCMLGLGMMLSACGLESLKNPAPATATSSSSSSGRYIMQLLAGGASGAGYQDGNNTQSRFNAPQAVASDNKGHFYVADTGNNVIRMATFNPTTNSWCSVTVAGDGSPGTPAGYADTGGTVTSPTGTALFSGPRGIAVDASATAANSIAGTDLYVADTGNAVIRKVHIVSGGTPCSLTDKPVASVTTIVGTPNVTGSTDTVAGSKALFALPTSLAINLAAQELYVADSGNNRILRINLAPSGANCINAPTISGNGTATSGGVAGSGVECQYNVRLLAGYLHSVDDTVPSVVDGSGDLAWLDRPQGLVFVPKGTQLKNALTGALVPSASDVLYFTDTASSTIRELQFQQQGLLEYGVVTTLAGKRRLPGNDDSLVTLSQNQQFATPTTLTLVVTTVTYPAGHVGDYLSVTRPSSGPIACPTPLSASQTCTISTFPNNNNLKDPITPVRSSSPTLPTFNAPVGMALDPLAHTLLVADAGNDVIREIDPNTQIVRTVVGKLPVTTNLETQYFPGDLDAPLGANALVDHPAALAYDSSMGGFVLADLGNNQLRFVNFSISPSTWGDNFSLSTLLGKVTGYSDSIAATSTQPAVPAAFSDPSGIGFDSAGNAYIADSGNNSIRELDSSGNVTTPYGVSGDVPGFVDGSGHSARFSHPAGLVVDASTNTIYVADSGNNCIRKITIKDQNVATLAGSTSAGSADGVGTAAGFNNPVGLALDGNGHLYVTDAGNDTIRQVDLSTGAVVTVAGVAGQGGFSDTTAAAVATFRNPGGIAVVGNAIYVADTDNHTIRQLVYSGGGAGKGVVTTIAGTPGQYGSNDGTGTTALFHSPAGIVADSSGNLLVADVNNHLLRKLVPFTDTTTKQPSATVTTFAGVPGDKGFITGLSPGLLASPVGLVYNAGNLYVTMKHAVVKLQPFN